MATASAPPRSPTANWRPALKAVPSLQIPQNVLVEFLTKGYNYDDPSVGSIICEANPYFDQRDLQSALKLYGVAYEMGRLNYVYPPLMHDLLLRRVQILSMMGDFKRALYEADLGLQVVPHSPTLLLYSGILLSKVGRSDDANHAFQHAVVQARGLRDLVDCIVAQFAQARGHSEHAISICDQVLARTPRFPMALLTRGDAHKSHPSGTHNKEAEANYAVVLQDNPQVQPLLRDRFTLDGNQAHIDEIVIMFHPWLASNHPRPYEAYHGYQRRQPFLTVCLVLFAAARLRTWVSSTRLLRSVQQKHDELAQQQLAAERRLRELIEVQRNIAAFESHSEVWGPADPDHVLVRKYRRYWMERPQNFPRRSKSRKQETTAKPPSRNASSVELAPQAYTDVWRFPGGAFSAGLANIRQQRDLTISREIRPMSQSETYYAPTSTPAPASAVAAAPADAPAPSAVAPAQASAPTPAAAPAVLAPAALAPAAAASPAAPAAPSAAPAATGARAEAQMTTSTIQLEKDIALVANTGPAPASPCTARPPAPPASSQASEQATSKQSTQSRHKLAAMRMSKVIEQPRPIQKQPKPPIGHGWDEEQWIMKAFEISDAFIRGDSHSMGCGLDLDSVPSLDLHRMSPLQSVSAMEPSPPCNMYTSLDDKEVNFIDAIHQQGFGAIDDWYGALDRIYAITDMVQYTAEPEPFPGEAHRAGTPGYSYVVRGNSPPAPKPKPCSAPARGGGVSMVQRPVLHPEAAQRYSTARMQEKAEEALQSCRDLMTRLPSQPMRKAAK